MSGPERTFEVYCWDCDEFYWDRAREHRKHKGHFGIATLKEKPAAAESRSERE